MNSPWKDQEDVNRALATPRKDTQAARAFVLYEIAAAEHDEIAEKAKVARRDLERLEKAELEASGKLETARQKALEALGAGGKSR